ncbi:hypothetical protein J3F83DRAFT_744157 [Trichoderma novae-zelandiae]
MAETPIQTIYSWDIIVYNIGLISLDILTLPVIAGFPIQQPRTMGPPHLSPPLFFVTFTVLTLFVIAQSSGKRDPIPGFPPLGWTRWLGTEVVSVTIPMGPPFQPSLQPRKYGKQETGNGRRPRPSQACSSVPGYWI